MLVDLATYSLPSPPLFVILLVGFAYVAIRYSSRKSYLNDIAGPRSGSWLYGHQLAMNRQTNVGQCDFVWNETYGHTWRIDDAFGGELLMTSDPAAIHHILHTMGYNYPKTRLIRQFAATAFGRGVAWAADETHDRHRQVLAPAFTKSQIRTYLPTFSRVFSQLAQLWKEQSQEHSSNGNGTVPMIDINEELSHATLDIIGEAVFDYRFGALGGKKDTKFARIFHNLFADSNLHPSKFELVFTALFRYIPVFLLQWVQYLPTRQFARFREYLVEGKRLGRELLAETAVHDSAVGKGSEKQRNILSILSEENMNHNCKLDEDEILSQITTLLFAGHDTSATTLAWLFYELAHHPGDQARIQAEIHKKRAGLSANKDTLSAADYESMPFLNACLRETFRLHPISPWVTREARVDDIIPLSKPITSRSGTLISSIPVGPGMPVLVSTCAYNRNKDVWGEDAHLWRPERFLNPKLKEGQIPLGLVSNLSTFSGGLSGCIGWRFALLELQVAVIEILGAGLTFSPPPPELGIDVVRMPIGAIMAPMVEGQFEQRTQMPLVVSYTQFE